MGTILEKILTLINNSTSKFKTMKIWLYAKRQNISNSELNQIQDACNCKIKEYKNDRYKRNN